MGLTRGAALVVLHSRTDNELETLPWIPKTERDQNGVPEVAAGMLRNCTNTPTFGKKPRVLDPQSPLDIMSRLVGDSEKDPQRVFVVLMFFAGMLLMLSRFRILRDFAACFGISLA
jgi:hypothetical protein